MGYSRRNEWEADTEVYSPEQIDAIARYCGLEVVSETHTHFLAYCPFHNNTDDPAFALDKTKGLWTCFNPSCGEAGTLEELLRRVKGHNPFESAMVILKYKDSVQVPIADRLAQINQDVPEFVEFPQASLDRMKEEFWQYLRPINYMHQRGFEDETLQYFDIGYSKKQDMIIVPMHDPGGMPIGLVGRAIDQKRFKNSTNLPKSKTAWNYHRAKKCGDTVIIVESSFDAMRIHQAGYPNVIALLGGSITEHHVQQISRVFSTVVIMSDFDKKQYKANCAKCRNIQFSWDQAVKCVGHRPGRDLGRAIANRMPMTKILWAAYDDTCVYPHGAKDAGDMTDDEIRQCLKNAVSNFFYSQWDIEEKEPVAS